MNEFIYLFVDHLGAAQQTVSQPEASKSNIYTPLISVLVSTHPREVVETFYLSRYLLLNKLKE